jgi:hypothetical protein
MKEKPRSAIDQSFRILIRFQLLLVGFLIRVHTAVLLDCSGLHFLMRLVSTVPSLARGGRRNGRVFPTRLGLGDGEVIREPEVSSSFESIQESSRWGLHEEKGKAGPRRLRSIWQMSKPAGTKPESRGRPSCS